MEVIGLIGPMGSGKTAVVNGVLDRSPLGEVGAIAWADPLKAMIRTMVIFEGASYEEAEEMVNGRLKNKESQWLDAIAGRKRLPLKQEQAKMMLLAGIQTAQIEWLGWKAKNELFDNLTNTEVALTLIDWAHCLKDNPTPRHAMQTIGTEWGRAINEHLWVRMTHNRVVKLAAMDPRPALLFIDGTRFKNEVETIEALGGYSIGIRRPGVRYTGSHSSETEIEPRFWIDNDVPVDSTAVRLLASINSEARKKEAVA